MPGHTHEPKRRIVTPARKEQLHGTVWLRKANACIDCRGTHRIGQHTRGPFDDIDGSRPLRRIVTRG